MPNYSERRQESVCDEARTQAIVGHGNDPSRRQARYRAKQAQGTPTLRYRKPVDRRSRFQRWHDAVAELQALQSEYQAWLDMMPQNMADSGTAEALIAICGFDLSELEGIGPSHGFGRY